MSEVLSGSFGLLGGTVMGRGTGTGHFAKLDSTPTNYSRDCKLRAGVGVGLAVGWSGV